VHECLYRVLSGHCPSDSTTLQYPPCKGTLDRFHSPGDGDGIPYFFLSPPCSNVLSTFSSANSYASLASSSSSTFSNANSGLVVSRNAAYTHIPANTSAKRARDAVRERRNRRAGRPVKASNCPHQTKECSLGHRLRLGRLNGGLGGRLGGVAILSMSLDEVDVCGVQLGFEQLRQSRHITFEVVQYLGLLFLTLCIDTDASLIQKRLNRHFIHQLPLSRETRALSVSSPSPMMERSSWCGEAGEKEVDVETFEAAEWRGAFNMERSISVSKRCVEYIWSDRH
jgi:hypothetical protein